MASFFILILGLVGILDPVQGAFQAVSTPVEFGLRQLALDMKDGTRLFYNLNSIRKENLTLLKENQDLKSVIVDLRRAEEENQTLRMQLNLKDEQDLGRDLILASAVGNSADLTNTSIAIDKGSAHGVKVGDNVIKGKSIVGIVTSVSNRKSIVELITSPNVSATAKSTASSAEGIITGSLGTFLNLTRILPGESITIGDVFVTSGKDGHFLPELIIGEVTEVSFESAEPLKSAVVKPIIDFSRLDKVFIISLT